MVAVQRVPPRRRDALRHRAPVREEGRLVEIGDLVEKPSQEDAPSDLAVLGRYVLTPKIFDMLETDAARRRR